MKCLESKGDSGVHESSFTNDVRVGAHASNTQ